MNKAVILIHTADRPQLLATFLESLAKYPSGLQDWRLIVVPQGYEQPLVMPKPWEVVGNFPTKVGVYFARRFGALHAINTGAERLLFLDDDMEMCEFSTYAPLETILDTVRDVGFASATHGNTMRRTVAAAKNIGQGFYDMPIGCLAGGLMCTSQAYGNANLALPGPKGSFAYIADDAEVLARMYLSGYCNYRSRDAVVLHRAGSKGGLREAGSNAPVVNNSVGKPHLLSNATYVRVSADNPWPTRYTPEGIRVHNDAHQRRFGF